MKTRNRIYKTVKNSQNKPCGMISIRQNGDLLSVGVSGIPSKVVDRDDFHFDEKLGKSLADKRSLKAYKNRVKGLQDFKDNTQLVINTSKCPTVKTLSDAYEKVKPIRYIDEDGHEHLAVYI